MTATGISAPTRDDVRRRTRLSIAVSAGYTLVWFLVVTGFGLWDRIADLRPATITMIFGSLVAGSTPQGGGVVAFPVFTKIFGMPPEIARTFSLCIQSIGMTAATAWIVINRRQVEWRAVAIVTAAAAVGLVVTDVLADRGDLPFNPSILPAPYVKVTFTIVLVAMAFVVYEVTRVRTRDEQPILPPVTARTGGLLVVCGFLGGIASGLVGSGADVLLYLGVVLFLAVDPKVGVPTSVICMALVSVLGIVLFGIVDGHLFVTLDAAGDVVAVNGRPVTLEGGRLVHGVGPGAPAERYDVLGLWLACIPVVVWGAPIGTWIAARLTTRNLVRFVTVLALAEGISTAVFLRPLRTDMVLLAYFIFGIVVTVVVLRLIANRRARLFGLPIRDVVDEG